MGSRNLPKSNLCTETPPRTHIFMSTARLAMAVHCLLVLLATDLGTRAGVQAFQLHTAILNGMQEEQQSDNEGFFLDVEAEALHSLAAAPELASADHTDDTDYNEDQTVVNTDVPTADLDQTHQTKTTTASCFKAHSQYLPLNVPGQKRSKETNGDSCQKRCAGVEGCAHFSFFEDGGCHLHTSTATRAHSTKGTSGPPSCHQAHATVSLLAENTVTHQKNDMTAEKGFFHDAVSSVASALHMSKDSSLNKSGLDDTSKAHAVGSTTSAKSLKNVGCFNVHAQYIPLNNLPGQRRSKERSVDKCQQRCHSVATCAHFSYWINGGCHLHSVNASRIRSRLVTAGPPSCKLQPPSQAHEKKKKPSHVAGKKPTQNPNKNHVESQSRIALVGKKQNHSHAQNQNQSHVALVGKKQKRGIVETTRKLAAAVTSAFHRPATQPPSSNGTLEEWLQVATSSSTDEAVVVGANSTKVRHKRKKTSKACFTEHAQYLPLNVPGQRRTKEKSAEACQQRCAGLSGCAFFSWWSNGGCHTHGVNATRIRSPRVTAGPQLCEASARVSKRVKLALIDTTQSIVTSKGSHEGIFEDAAKAALSVFKPSHSSMRPQTELVEVERPVVISSASACFETNFQYLPVNMPGQKRSVTSLEACQNRCASVTGCAHFSWWIDGGCHVHSSAAKRKKAHGITAGPPSCVGTKAAVEALTVNATVPEIGSFTKVGAPGFEVDKFFTPEVNQLFKKEETVVVHAPLAVSLGADEVALRASRVRSSQVIRPSIVASAAHSSERGAAHAVETTVGTLKDAITASETEGETQLVALMQGCESELRLQRENNTELSKDVDGVVASITKLKHDNSMKREYAVSLQRLNVGLRKELEALSTNASLAREYAMEQLNASNEIGDKVLAVLDELEKKDAVEAEAEEHYKRLSEIYGPDSLMLASHASRRHTPMHVQRENDTEGESAQLQRLLATVGAGLEQAEQQQKEKTIAVQANFQRELASLVTVHSDLVTQHDELSAEVVSLSQLSGRLSLAVKHLEGVNEQVRTARDGFRHFMGRVGKAE